MMDERFKKLVTKLNKKLQLNTMEFIIEHLNNEENANDIINLVLSSHISSLYNSMKSVTGDNENDKKRIEEFFNGLCNFLNKDPNISNISEMY